MTKRKVPGVDSRKTKPKAVQTMETLLARTEEIGDCRQWLGYVGNKVPQVSHDGKVIAVRRLMLTLNGKELRTGDSAGVKCGHQWCVEPEHIAQRDKSQHARKMSKSPNRNEQKRAANVAAFKRANGAKITMEQAREIRASDESGHVLAGIYGIDKARIARIRRNEAWKEFSSPFSGLGAR
jgi:hypothetical protein